MITCRALSSLPLIKVSSQEGVTLSSPFSLSSSQMHFLLTNSTFHHLNHLRFTPRPLHKGQSLEIYCVKLYTMVPDKVIWFTTIGRVWIMKNYWVIHSLEWSCNCNILIRGPECSKSGKASNGYLDVQLPVISPCKTMVKLLNLLMQRTTFVPKFFDCRWLPIDMLLKLASHRCEEW